MSTFDIAQVTGQGLDLIIVPLHANFQFRTAAEQSGILADLQRAARNIGLTGTVVPVWDSGNGRMAFLAPPDYRSFLDRIDLGFVAENINGILKMTG